MAAQQASPVGLTPLPPTTTLQSHIWDSRLLDALVLTTGWLYVAADPHNTSPSWDGITSFVPSAAQCNSPAAIGVTVGTGKQQAIAGAAAICTMLASTTAAASLNLRCGSRSSQDLLGCNNSALPAHLRAFDAAMYHFNLVSTQRGRFR